MLLVTLGALISGNMLTGKEVKRVRKGFVRAGAGYNNMDYMNVVF